MPQACRQLLKHEPKLSSLSGAAVQVQTEGKRSALFEFPLALRLISRTIIRLAAFVFAARAAEPLVPTFGVKAILGFASML